MARKIIVLSQVLCRNGCDEYVPITAKEEEVTSNKGSDRMEAGFCGCCRGASSKFIISISLHDESISGLWKWLSKWVSAKKNGGRMCVEGKVILERTQVVWKRVYWKVKSELRKSLKPKERQRFTYDAESYSQNFDEGCWKEDNFHFCARKFGAGGESN